MPEPLPIDGGAAACFAAALFKIAGTVVASGAGHSAISGPPATAGGSVLDLQYTSL